MRILLWFVGIYLLVFLVAAYIIWMKGELKTGEDLVWLFFLVWLIPIMGAWDYWKELIARFNAWEIPKPKGKE